MGKIGVLGKESEGVLTLPREEAPVADLCPQGESIQWPYLWFQGPLLELW